MLASCRLVSLQESARRAWVTIAVPGTDCPRYSTYVRYDASALPKLPPDLQQGDGLGWLRDLPEVGQGMLPDEHSYITTPLIAQGIERLMEAAGLTISFASLPEDLRAFVTEPALHRRLFSATDAYLDAGERLAPVPGGHLLHLVSDSQWVSHWLAFIGTDGSTGVVCTPAGLGYDDVEKDADEHSENGDLPELIWVADSVAEFVWRWWADNYAFAQAQPSHTPSLEAPDWFDLTAYVAGYTRPGQ